MIEENSIITIGNNYKYLVAFSTMHNNHNYLYLTNIENPLDSVFYEYLGNNNLKIVKDKQLFKILLKKFEEEKINNQ